MNFIKNIAYALTVLGALNWGCIGLFDINLVSLLFGTQTVLSKTLYSLIGISAIILMATRSYWCSVVPQTIKINTPFD